LLLILGFEAEFAEALTLARAVWSKMLSHIVQWVEQLAAFKAYVQISLHVSALPEHAFEVFTGEIGTWWRPNAFVPFYRQPTKHPRLQA
jgi:hypothetical protein